MRGDRAMSSRKGLVVVVMGLFILGGIALTGGCLFKKVEGEVRSDTKTVEADGAERLEAHIEFGAGDLRIDGRSDEMFNADYKYAFSIREPKIKYEVKGSTGELLVRDIERKVTLGLGGFETEWMLSFSPDIPIEIDIDFGAGTGRLNLADLDIEGLDLDLGAGSANVNLAGIWDHDVDVDIDQGIGEVTIHVSSAMPVRVEVDRGLGNVVADDFRMLNGDYVNDAYDEDEDLPTITINIDQGIGNTVLKLVDLPDDSAEDDGAELGQLTIDSTSDAVIGITEDVSP